MSACYVFNYWDSVLCCWSIISTTLLSCERGIFKRLVYFSPACCAACVTSQQLAYARVPFIIPRAISSENGVYSNSTARMSRHYALTLLISCYFRMNLAYSLRARRFFSCPLTYSNRLFFLHVRMYQPLFRIPAVHFIAIYRCTCSSLHIASFCLHQYSIYA